MNCAKCHMTLQITERQGVEIDFCPACRGIWLDSGELDKIIDRSKSYDQPNSSGYDHHRGYKDSDKYYKKKETFY